jgi:hypothetical protein
MGLIFLNGLIGLAAYAGIQHQLGWHSQNAGEMALRAF